MNKLNGTIINIHQSGAVLLADVEASGQEFSALLIDSASHAQWLKAGATVALAFKETEVSIAKNLSGQISLRNQMACRITDIEQGELLSMVGLDFKGVRIVSVITSRAVLALSLSVGDDVTALIKSNEMSLMRLTNN